MLERVEVRLKEKYMMPLPDIFNLENQTLTLSLTDNKTGHTYPFITISMADPRFLLFEPIDKEYVGDHLVRLVLSDNLGASTAYLLKMKILPLINKGAPFFTQLPGTRSFKVALGGKFSEKFDYPTDDPDPEDNDKKMMQTFKIPTALSQFLTYDTQTKILECTMPLTKPPSITLNLAYSLRLALNDMNPAGPR